MLNENTSYISPLTLAGLTEDQAIIYDILLKFGAQPAGNISEKTPIKRGLVYKNLETLTKMGVVIKRDAPGKVATFEPAHPLKLKELAEKKAEEAKNAQTALASVLDKMSLDFHLISGKPGVKFYEGKDGIKAIHEEILSEKKEIYAYVYLKKEWDDSLGQKFWDWYYSERIKSGIHVRAITVNNEEGKAYQKKDADELRETKLFPESEFPIEIEKNICGNKVAFFSLKPNQEIGILIESPIIANTEKSIFLTLFNTTSSTLKKNKL